MTRIVKKSHLRRWSSEKCPHVQDVRCGTFLPVRLASGFFDNPGAQGDK